VSRLSRGDDKKQDAPVPGLLGTMAGGAAVCVLLGPGDMVTLTKSPFRIANTG
jgi:hypothetical protein